MTLLNLWGLIALLSLVILFLIYFLRPNYQTNNVSSTFIWKLSLKYRKKSLPVSKLKNIILIILQVLFLAGLAFMLARPVIIKKGLLQEESLIIIDASCSMRVGDEGDTRFDRAVEEAREKALAEGKEATKIENARNLLAMKLGTHEQIAKAVELPLEKIEELAAEMSAKS